MEKPVKWLNKVAEQHNEWIRIVKSFGEYQYCEDIVQEMYLTIYKYADERKIIKNNIVSRGYIFFTLRSIYFQYYNKKGMINKVYLDDYNINPPDQTNMEEQEAFHKLCTKIDNYINDWHWYEKKLFEIYRDTDLSIRKIANKTNISWVSIFNTLKNSKTEIRKKFNEDYEDLKNEDYERI
jgi:DNA-directed RNA polymerase specialized sigma24 family protein